MAPKKKKIDAKKVCKAKHTGNHHVDYWLYKTKKSPSFMPKGEPGDHGTGVCFSSLLNKIKGRKIKPNRVLYVMEDDDNGEIILTLEEKREFIKMSRKHGLLPKYVKYEWIGENKVSRLVLDIEGMSPSLLYAYLCNFRYIREDPGFVRALVYMVNTLKIDFYVAYVIGHRVCLQWGGHTVLDYLAGYPAENDPNNMSIDVKVIASLYRYLKDPEKYDKRGLLDKLHSFNCQDSINKACKVAGKVNSVKFFTKKLGEVIRKSDDKIKEYVKKEGV